MDIYTAITRIIAECLALGNGILSQFVSMPANATGPLDPSTALTSSGFAFAEDLAAAATKASSILSTMFEALF